MATNALTSPATGVHLGTWAESTPTDVAAAVDSARRGQRRLTALSRWERCDLLLETGRQLAKRRNLLVNDLLAEHGKVQAEAVAEVDNTIHSLSVIAEYARRLDGTMPAMSDGAKRVLVDRIPLGVIGVITPWNFPVMIPIEYLAPALVMGNSVVWKGAETTPRATAHIAAAFADAGWPEDALTVIEGGPETGAALVADQRLAAVCFTGSTSVGHRIAQVGGMRKLVLELGGNGPTVVFDDADLERMAQSVATAATFCSGQSCAATERILVQESCYAEALEAIVAAAAARQVGDPHDAAAAFGPLHLAQTADTMREHIHDAQSRGARVAHGGAPLTTAPTDRYWPLTVLDGVSPNSLAFTDETFGPVIPLTVFTDESELAELAGIGGYGLSGAVFTADLDRAFRVGESLSCGSVVINDHSNVWEPHLPFGGYPSTNSGIGRVGGPYVLEELSTLRSMIVHIGGR